MKQDEKSEFFNFRGRSSGELVSARNDICYVKLRVVIIIHFLLVEAL